MVSESDHDYWRRRHWQECRNADRARTPEARVFHRRLAQADGDRLLKRAKQGSASSGENGREAGTTLAAVE